jgi:ABC-type bacteriocin/lantibiotic exporter with double-glycine peptidase domain
MTYQNRSSTTQEAQTSNREPDWHQGWLTTGDFVNHLCANSSTTPPLKGSRVLARLKELGPESQIKAAQLLAIFESEFSVITIQASNYKTIELYRLTPLLFANKGDQFLPANALPATINSKNIPPGTKILFITDTLPNRKVSKWQLVNLLLQQRYGKFLNFFVLGTIPILLLAISELFSQPLFDSFVPSGSIPVILLVGVATIAFQLCAQFISTITQQAQTVFNGQVDLVSQLAVGQRFLSARGRDLAERDIGSWKLSLSVSSSFLGSLEVILISIPLALFSLLVNLVVIGAYSDFSAIGHLLLICLIPATLSMLVSYLSSSIAIRMMGQQSRLETTIYTVVRNIRGIWMSNSESHFCSQFADARKAMASSLLRSGTIAASTDIIDKLTSGILYAFIYYEYYRSTLTVGGHHASVGSLLVIYSAIGTVTGSLSSLTGDLITIFQTLPTYWMPNAIRDIDSYMPSIRDSDQRNASVIKFENVTYNAKGINGPFKSPLTFDLKSPGHIAITGPSGSGKSTLLKLILGHLKPTSGVVRLIDPDQNEVDADLCSTNVLVLNQDVLLCGQLLRDVADPAGDHDEAALEEAAAQLNLGVVLDQLPLRWQTPINEFSRDLSLGQLQLFKLMRALLKRYNIILTDEPTCHLPEDQHLQALKLLNSACDLHISVLHRASGLSQFDQQIKLDSTGTVAMGTSQPR